MKRASNTDIGNMDWKCRDWGYNAAVARPSETDVEVLIAVAMPSIRFSAAQRGEFLQSANYAYMMRLKHRSAA